MKTKPHFLTSRLAIPSLLLSLSMSFLASCGDGPGGIGCTEIYIYGLNVTVKDDAAGVPICDAVVTAVDGAYTETLEAQAFGGDCTYNGAGERAGSYTITAKKTGFKDATQNVVVTADRCHVKGVAVMLSMTR